VLADGTGSAAHIEIIRSTSGLAASVVGFFREPTAVQHIPGGGDFVFDLSGYGVCRISPSWTDAVRIVQMVESSAPAPSHWQMTAFSSPTNRTDENASSYSTSTEPQYQTSNYQAARRRLSPSAR